MYINFKLIYEKNLTLVELMILIAINQREAILMKDIPFEYFEEQDWIIFIKGNGTKEERVRLSKNGKALLDALTTKGASEEVLTLTQNLVELYEYNGKEAGNTLEIRDRLIWFINATGVSDKVIQTCVEDYLTTSGDFTMRLDNLIWKPQSSAFSINYNLSDSRLFNIIMKKYNLPIQFFLKPSEKRTVKDTWLFDILKLKVPKGLSEEMYWTGTEKGDKDALARIKNQFRFM